MAKNDEHLDLSQEQALAGILAILAADREDRLAGKAEPRKTELVLSKAGLGYGEIAKLLGKKYESVKTTIRRGAG